MALRRAALATGGSDIWIRSAAPGEGSPPGTSRLVRALATPHVFETAPAALENEARAHSVQFDLRQGKNRKHERTLEIRFLRDGKILEAWEIREVPKLLRATIVIDDMGANEKAAAELLALHYPLTFSVLPNLRYSRQTALEAHQAGREVMLHLPMEPIPRPGFFATPGEVREGMDRSQVEGLVERDLAAVPYVQGVNNHEGSQATQDGRLMAEVMQVLASRHLYFIDSRTTGASVALRAARRAGLPAFYRSVFLDDTSSVNYILAQLKRFRSIIDQQGMALAIGHPHPETIRALAEFLPRLSEDDIELVPASRLVALPQAAQLFPPGAGKDATQKREQKVERSKTPAPSGF